MKRINHLLFMLLFCYTKGFAQRQFGSETLPMRTICPCETAKFFKTRQDIDMTMRPFNLSYNCYIPIPISVSTDGTYLFKKRQKRKKAQFPKGSHIIPLWPPQYISGMWFWISVCIVSDIRNHQSEIVYLIFTLKF